MFVIEKENESLTQKLEKFTNLQEDYDNLKKENEDNKAVREGYSKVTSTLHAIFQKHRIIHSHEVGERLNDLFGFAKLSGISFYQPLLSTKTETIESITPTLPQKIEKQRSFINQIKKQLLTFPISTSFTEESEIEDELKQIYNYLIKLNKAFKDHIAHIDGARSILSSTPTKTNFSFDNSSFMNDDRNNSKTSTGIQNEIVD